MSTQSKLDHCREVLKRLVAQQPCTLQGACKCITCLAEHALAASSPIISPTMEEIEMYGNIHDAVYDEDSDKF